MAAIVGDGPDRTGGFLRPVGGYQVVPAYPEGPRRLGIQGTSHLRVEVLATGVIGQVVVDRTAGHPDLDRAAVTAVRTWRFEPARRDGEPVAVWATLDVFVHVTAAPAFARTRGGLTP